MSKVHICSYRLDANPDYIRIYKSISKQSLYPSKVVVEEPKKQEVMESYTAEKLKQ